MSNAFEIAWTLVKNEEKNEEKKRSGHRFKGYSKNRISGRAERAGKARAWSQSRKVKRGRTRKRYARNKKRGNVRPKLRRQLGAGGERIQIKKAPKSATTQFRKIPVSTDRITPPHWPL